MQIESGKPVGQGAKERGANETTLASWVSLARRVGVRNKERCCGQVGGGTIGVKPRLPSCRPTETRP